MHELGRQRARVGVGDDLVVLSVLDQHRHRDLLEVLGEVGLGEGNDAVVVRLGPAHHPLAPPVLDDGLVGLDPGPVEAVERSRGQGPVEDRAVGRQLGLEVVEDALGQAAGVGVGLAP